MALGQQRLQRQFGQIRDVGAGFGHAVVNGIKWPKIRTDAYIPHACRKVTPLFPAERDKATAFGVQKPGRCKHAAGQGISAEPRKELMEDELIEELKGKLIALLNLQDVQPEDFDPDARLVGGDLGIDSIDVLEMVVMVEKDYGVTINNQEMGQQVFASLRQLADYIRRHRVADLP